MATAWDSVRSGLCTLVGSVLLLWIVAFDVRAAAPAPSGNAESVDSQSAPGVVISATKEPDRRTFEHVLVPQFIESHSIASEVTGQLSRWRAQVCPETIGLQKEYGDFISRRVTDIARSIGAPTDRTGKCRPNVDIIFAPHPQAVLDGIVSRSPMLLGYPGDRSKPGQIRHSIEAFYVTGTRSSDTLPKYNGGPSSARPAANGGGMESGGPTSAAWHSTGEMATGGHIQIDGQLAPVMGTAGSHLSHGLASEFVQVTVIADADALTNYPLRTIADYIAMLVLTRAALESCSPLPSIIDLLAVACNARPRPQVMTATDTEYLKALYASNLELNVNLERGEMRSRMVQSIKLRPAQ